MFKIKYIFFVALFLLNARILPQADTLYYGVIEKDTLYYLLSNRSLMILSSNGNGNFYLQNVKHGNYNVNTRLSVNEKYILLHHQDSVYLFNKDNPFGFIAKSKIPFTVKTIWPFGNDFVFMTNTLVKIVGLSGDSIKVKNDSVALAEGQLVSYPFLIKGKKIYKYIEGFGYYEVYSLSDAITTLVVYGNKMVFHTWIQPNPQMPPQECDLRVRLFQEPNFPAVWNYEDWGLFDYLSYSSPFESASDKYIKLLWGHDELIYNYSGNRILSDTSSTNTLVLTNRYLFSLGPNIKHSTSIISPVIFNNLQIVTEIKSEEIKNSEFFLFQNYPNPFNPSTKISWQSPVSSWQTLKVYDVLGNEVATLVDEYKPVGSYEVGFQSTVGSLQLASGVYYYQLRVADFVQTKKMILLR